MAVLCFMVKELLGGYRATPPANNAKQQQSGLRHSAPGPARCHFIRTVHCQRQYVGEQNHITKGCEVKMQPNAVKMSSK